MACCHFDHRRSWGELGYMTGIYFYFEKKVNDQNTRAFQQTNKQTSDILDLKVILLKNIYYRKKSLSMILNVELNTC